MTDPLGELAVRFRNGDQAAFHLLHAQIGPGLLAFLAAHCPAQTDRDDAAQEIWLKAWGKRDLFVDGHFRGWVFEIARNWLKDNYRRIARRPAHVALGEYDATDNDGTKGIESEALELKVAALRDCLELVGGDFVKVLRMRLDAVSTEEIADQMGISKATVDSRASRGKQQLRECLERKLS